MQSVSSTAPVDWATGHSLRESYLSVEMQSVYSTAPADWASWDRLEYSEKYRRPKDICCYLDTFEIQLLKTSVQNLLGVELE